MSNKKVLIIKKNKMFEIIELSDDEMNNYDEIRGKDYIIEKMLIKIGSININGWNLKKIIKKY